MLVSKINLLRKDLLLPLYKKSTPISSNNKDKKSNNNNNIKEVTTYTIQQLNIFNNTAKAANSRQPKGANPKAYIRYILKGKLYIYTKVVINKLVPTSYIKYKAYSKKNIIYYKVSFRPQNYSSLLTNLLFAAP